MLNWLFARHPRGLPMLFFSEMWERFSFYGMRALLVLYMVKALGYPEDVSYGVYAAYGALVYAFPVLGGAMANAVLGYKRAIVFGGTLMAIGQMALALNFGPTTLYLGLACLCVGNGFFKPNISSTVGTLYNEGDPRRTSGFTIFYMGINLGAFLAPLVCGPLGENVGWGVGFAMAGIGMAVGVATFLLGQDRLEGRGEAPDYDRLQRYQYAVYGGAIALVPLTAFLLYEYSATKTGLLFAMAAIFGYLLFVAFREKERESRSKLYALMILMIFHAFFWGLFEQAGSSLTLYADRCVDRHGIPTSTMQSINAFFILFYGPFFSSLWLALSARKKNPSIPAKFAYGLIQLGIGFAVLNLGNSLAGEGARTGLLFLVLAYMFHTTGELCLSPVGLSAVTQLAPKRITGFVMGAWFMTIGLGHIMAGEVAKLTKLDFAPNAAVMALAEPRYRLPAGGGLDTLERLPAGAAGETLARLLPRLVAQGVPVSGVLDKGVKAQWFGAGVKQQLAPLSLDGASEAAVGTKLGEFLHGDGFQETLYYEIVTSKYVVEKGKPLETLKSGELGASSLGGFLAAGRALEPKVSTKDSLAIAVQKGLIAPVIAERIESIVEKGGGDDKAAEALDAIVVQPIKQRYDPVYFGAFAFAVGAGLLLLLLSPLIRRMMHGVE
ncbi:MAG: peptide MFS transporter [Planctomycetes bacterium]|nr:peptide MFS transporter [Planctomycetota bacterium]